MTAPRDLPSWLALIRAPGVGPAQAARLLRHFGSPDDIFRGRPRDWREAGVPASVHDGLAKPDAAGIDRDLAWLTGGSSRRLLTLADTGFPRRLLEVPDAPIALFCQGDPSWLERPQLAVVGARSATPQGLETAEGFARELAGHGLVVTSGLAQGIDGAAHRGALAADGGTIAVCGTGLDRVYPARHRELAHEIAGRGLLVSEFPVGTPPKAEHFPRRNRVLAGLSLGVLVVEAASRSGSLITARLAMEQGREVFAIPGSIHNPLTRGTHALIRQGAKLTESVPDILDELAPLLGLPVADRDADGAMRPRPGRLDAEQQRVLDALGHDATSLDTLVERLGQPVSKLSATLLALELSGHVAVAPGGAFVRTAPR